MFLQVTVSKYHGPFFVELLNWNRTNKSMKKCSGTKTKMRKNKTDLSRFSVGKQDTDLWNNTRKTKCKALVRSENLFALRNNFSAPLALTLIFSKALRSRSVRNERHSILRSFSKVFMQFLSIKSCIPWISDRYFKDLH